MKKHWKSTLFFVLCLLVFVVINTPLTLILGQISLPNNIKLNGVKGAIIGGKVTAIYVNQFPILDINYRADLSCLLTLSLCYQIDYQNGTGNISFNPLTRTTTIRQLDIDYTMTELSSLMNQLLVKPTGELNLKLNQINIQQHKISNLEGFAIWSNAGIAGEDINLGDYQLDIVREVDSYRFELTDREATLDIDGKGQLKSNGQYSFDIKIVAKSNLDTRIKGMLDLVARKKGLNEYAILRQGSLPQPLINQLDFTDPN